MEVIRIFDLLEKFKEAQTRRRILGVRNQRWNNVLSTMIELSFEENKLPQEEVDLNKNVVSKFIPFDDSSTNV